MFTTIRRSTSKFFENSWIFLDVVLDDPQGDDLFRLEARVHHLEAEVKTLRSLLDKSGVGVGGGQ
ncbi:hypothetical protein [Pararhizobium sp. LjRoot238]|uniref:hypothetical protein n=1 Tax=Pararhizobium sp. LjRoot238 TaxID=3342293 RepID=UPI003ED103F5